MILIRLPDGFLRFPPVASAADPRHAHGRFNPAMPAPLLLPAVVVSIPWDESPVKREANLKGRLPDSHESAAGPVPVSQVAQTRWRGRNLAE